MYQQLAKYLSQFKQVSIPQVGTFELVQQSAMLDVASKLIQPPTYLPQYSDKDFVILHSLDGYDEVSLTSPFKLFFNEGEKIVEPHHLGLPVLKYENIKGGQTIEESAKIFQSILEGNGTKEQNAAVMANAGMALYCANRKDGLINAVAKAEESLKSGRALQAFKNLIEN